MPTPRRSVLPVTIAGAFVVAGAHADIVYTDIPDLIVGPDQRGEVDLNADGVADIAFITSAGSFFYCGALGMSGAGVYADEIESLVIEWQDEAPIGPDVDPADLLSYSDMQCALEWAGGKGSPDWADDGAYMGVRFPIAGQDHFAWISVGAASGTVTVFDFAYESTPGTPIAAGAVPGPAALALLALGASVAARRVRYPAG